MAQTYHHKPLASKRRIRVLDLLPARKRDAPVRCRIRQIRLKDARDQYEALSYVWGAKEGSVPIDCEGRQLLVTPNCHDALIELRSKSDIRPLWIDAICIDQGGAIGSTEERNHQVRLMGKIYQKASTVVVWLGLGAPRITTARHIMSRMLSLLSKYHWIQHVDGRSNTRWEAMPLA
ncbi:hypothetical protein PG984_010195 [Apiospora sp. TS-2023a]